MSKVLLLLVRVTIFRDQLKSIFCTYTLMIKKSIFYYGKMFVNSFCTLPQMQRLVNFYVSASYFEFKPRKPRLEITKRVYNKNNHLTFSSIKSIIFNNYWWKLTWMLSIVYFKTIPIFFFFYIIPFWNESKSARSRRWNSPTP